LQQNHQQVLDETRSLLDRAEHVAAGSIIREVAPEIPKALVGLARQYLRAWAAVAMLAVGVVAAGGVLVYNRGLNAGYDAGRDAGLAKADALVATALGNGGEDAVRQWTLLARWNDIVHVPLGDCTMVDGRRACQFRLWADPPAPPPTEPTQAAQQAPDAAPRGK
jgi:hypothetical protein